MNEPQLLGLRPPTGVQHAVRLGYTLCTCVHFCASGLRHGAIRDLVPNWQGDRRLLIIVVRAEHFRTPYTES